MKLFFRKYGKGPAIIILHGLYGSSDNWVTVAGKLAQRFTVYLPDLRNHGLSPHDSVHSYDSQADDIRELFEYLGLKKAILAGHSMGGKVAMNFALKWPELISGLVVVDISPFGSSSEDSSFFLEHRKILEAVLATRPDTTSSRESIENQIAASGIPDRTRSFIMKNLKRLPGGNFEWKLNARDLLANLPVITAGVVDPEAYTQPVTGFPVVFIKGEKSDYLRYDEFKRISDIFPAAEFVTVKDADHWVHAEKPGEVISVFLSLAGGH